MRKAILGCISLALAGSCLGQTLSPRHIETPVTPYPPTARAARLQGKIMLKMTIDAEGNVKNAEVIDDIAHRAQPVLQEAAIENIRLWTFEKPATVPTTQVIVYEYKFDNSLHAKYPAQVSKISIDLPDRVTIISSEAFVQPAKLKTKKTKK